MSDQRPAGSYVIITPLARLSVIIGLIFPVACGRNAGDEGPHPLPHAEPAAAGRSRGDPPDSIHLRDPYYLQLKRELASLLSGAGEENDLRRRKRMDQIEANLDRCRRLPGISSDELIRVDVATQRLEVIAGGRLVQSMKVVVGLPAWQTPVFASAIDRIVVNPTWLSPRHILAAEILGYIKADSNYLRANVMTLLRWKGDSVAVVDPGSIDWKGMTPQGIDFAVRQEPGPGNIMGRLKFLADNPHSIFLHDTPYRDDFGKDRRLASHGCIRLERAFELAAWLLNREGERDTSWLRRTLDGVKEQTIRLRKPVPVRVEYRTVQFDSAGRARYLEDVYDLDRKKDTTQAATVTEGICSVFDSGSTWLPLRLSCLAA